MKKSFVEDLKPGESVDSLFSVKYKRAVTQYANGWRFAFGAADKTGEIEVSYWGGDDRAAVQEAHDSFQEGGVVRVQGFVGSWKDRKKIDVNQGKGSITQAKEFDLKDFLPETKKSVEAMYAELLGLVDGVRHEGLKKVLNAFFRDEEFAEEFKRAPAAMSYHHAWLGGLLEHSLAVARIALEAGKEYGADRDLLTAGALLHDVGKIKEFEVSTSIKVGEEGMLRGHIPIGEELVRRKAKETGLDEHALRKLSHIILSHHGKQEFGSPKPPMFVEAILVYYADELDSKAAQFARIKEETNTEDFRVYDKKWGQVYLK